MNRESIGAAVFRAPGNVGFDSIASPRIQDPRDAVVRIAAAGICGSDLWGYRGLEEIAPGQVMGHEWLGVVEAVGSSVRSVQPGDLVLAPFWFADGSCPACQRGQSIHCENGGPWGFGLQVGGGQAEAIRAPFADATLVKLPAETANQPDAFKRLLPLTDVLPTGHYAARCAGVRSGSTVVVVGDGPVGLCAVLAARRLGAERVFVIGRHDDRLHAATRLGADYVVHADRDDLAAINQLTGGGADAVLECVGSQATLNIALQAVRNGGGIGYVGMPVSRPMLSAAELFERGVSFRGGFAPARECITELLPEVLSGTLDASGIFSHEIGLPQIGEGYRLMNERNAIKVLVLRQ